MGKQEYRRPKPADGGSWRLLFSVDYALERHLMSSLNLFALVLLIFSLCACSPEPSAPPQNQLVRMQFTKDLLALINRADHIDITEHPFEGDAFDEHSAKLLVSDNLIYDQRAVTGAQTLRLVAILKDTDQEADRVRQKNVRQFGDDDPQPACLFAPHHTITLKAGSKVLDSIQVCFECGAARWTANTTNIPRAMVPGLHKFIKEIGLRPDRDWRTLAIRHLEQRGVTAPLE